MYVFFEKRWKLLKKCNEIWKGVSNITKKEFDSNPVYNKKYIKTKIKSYKGKINTNFHNNEISKEGSEFICESVILLDSVYKKDKNYYPQVFLEECKYVVKERSLLRGLLMTTYKFFLMILIKKILMKKILIKKIKYRIFLRKYKFSPENIRNFLILGLKSSISESIRKFRFLKYKDFLGVSVSWSIINFPAVDFFNFFELPLKSAGFRFRKYKKCFLLIKYKNCFQSEGFSRKKYKKFLYRKILRVEVEKCRVLFPEI